MKIERYISLMVVLVVGLFHGACVLGRSHSSAKSDPYRPDLRSVLRACCEYMVRAGHVERSGS